jgi:MFS family permease
MRANWRALVLLCTANFMVILDSQIVVLALPSIERDLGFGGVDWVLTAYLVSFGGLLLLGGRAGDLLGRRAVFMAGTALFLVSSLLCGFAWTGDVLVGARVVQGVSAAAMAPSALSLLTTTFSGGADGADRNKALAIWSATGGFGATAALLVGGGLTGTLGWEWIFFLNVPVALALLVLTPSLLRESRDQAKARAYDPVGAVTVTAALAVGVYALAEGAFALLAVSAALFVVFTLVERRSAAPLMPLRILRSRQLVGGNLVMAASAMCAFGMSFLIARYAQVVLGYPPLLFGVATAVMPLMAVVGAGFGQAFVGRVGARWVTATGAGLLAVGLLLFTGVSGGSYVVELLPGLVVFGLGLGAATVGAAVAALGGVAESEAGLASGINTAAFQIGGAIGVALVSPVLMAHGFGAGFFAAVACGVFGVVVALLLPRTSNDVVQTRGGKHAVPAVDLR